MYVLLWKFVVSWNCGRVFSVSAEEPSVPACPSAAQGSFQRAVPAVK